MKGGRRGRAGSRLIFGTWVEMKQRPAKWGFMDNDKGLLARSYLLVVPSPPCRRIGRGLTARGVRKQVLMELHGLWASRHWL